VVCPRSLLNNDCLVMVWVLCSCVATQETGFEQLTTVPRDVERVEAICQGGHYDPVTGKVSLPTSL
jgi:hypothetical protein